MPYINNVEKVKIGINENWKLKLQSYTKAMYIFSKNIYSSINYFEFYILY